MGPPGVGVLHTSGKEIDVPFDPAWQAVMLLMLIVNPMTIPWRKISMRRGPERRRAAPITVQRRAADHRTLPRQRQHWRRPLRAPEQPRPTSRTTHRMLLRNLQCNQLGAKSPDRRKDRQMRAVRPWPIRWR